MIRSSAQLILFIAFFGALFTYSTDADADRSAVLARVGSEKITAEQLAESNPKLASWFGLGATAEEAQNVLDTMILQVALAREAKRIDLDEEPHVKSQIQAVLANAYLEKNMPKSSFTVDEQELEQYYVTHRSEYALPEKIEISHILVSSLGKAHSIQKQLASGARFEDLARKRSIDPATSRRAGSLGLVEPRTLLPELIAAAEPLKPGEISEPVKTNFGYHIVRLEQRSEPSYKPLDEVRDDAYADAIREKHRIRLQELKDRMWSRYRVRVDEEAILQMVQGPEVSKREDSVVRKVEASVKGGRLQLLSRISHLGTVKSSSVKGTSLIVNDGNAELNVRGVKSACRCLEAEVKPTKLKPGQIGRITYTFNPRFLKSKGAVEQMLFIETDDPERPREPLLVTADLKRG